MRRECLPVTQEKLTIWKGLLVGLPKAVQILRKRDDGDAPGVLAGDFDGDADGAADVFDTGEL